MNIYRLAKVLNECVKTKMNVDSTKLINFFHGNETDNCVIESFFFAGNDQ